jgi:transposase
MKKPPKSRRRRRAVRNRASKTQHAINTTANPNAGGIDVGAEEMVVAVPPDRDPCPVRTFPTFTSGLTEMCEWLVERGITTVAMESTGNYWITAYDMLESAGIEVYLVNARHVKGVPGKKTDVCDAQWLQQLHAAGLLKKSFRPEQEILPLRYLMRHRAGLIEESSRQVLLMQKVLTEMNLKIHHVFSDLDGTSAQAIITSILGGQRDAYKLAALRDPRCRAELETVVAALEGNYREDYLFVLKQSQALWQSHQAAIAECDERIAAVASAIKTPPAGPQDPGTPCTPVREKKGKNAPLSNLCAEARRFFGVDLSSIDGVGTSLLVVLMSEVGTGGDLRAHFPTAERFCSWLGLCPDNRISGGQVLSARTRPVKNRLAAALRMCALGVANAKSKMGEYSRRMKGRLGKAEGITATAHKIARIIYAMITTGKPYDEEQAFKVSPAGKARQLQRLQKQAASMGLALVAAD